jgi:hypothetical protein
MGVRGLSSGVSGVNFAFIMTCQSYILCLSSATVRNRRTFAHGSLDVSPAVRLDLRLRCFSDMESGFISSIRVGRELPCFRCCSVRISQVLKAEIGCCEINSQSP